MKHCTLHFLTLLLALFLAVPAFAGAKKDYKKLSGTTSIEALEAFIEEYPKSKYADKAKFRIRYLKKRAEEEAERARIEEEKRKERERKLAEDRAAQKELLDNVASSKLSEEDKGQANSYFQALRDEIEKKVQRNASATMISFSGTDIMENPDPVIEFDGDSGRITLYLTPERQLSFLLRHVTEHAPRYSQMSLAIAGHEPIESKDADLFLRVRNSAARVIDEKGEHWEYSLYFNTEGAESAEKMTEILGKLIELYK